MATSAPVLDGVRDGSYGAAVAAQSVETGFGDNFSELNATYVTVEGGTLYLMLAGNLESNFNKLNIFIDSKGGGQNVLQNDGNSGGNDPENDGWAGKHAGMTFDTGFEADFLLTLRNGNSGGDGAGGFTGALSGINLNQFPGDQFFVVPEPGSLAMLALLILLRRRV